MSQHTPIQQQHYIHIQTLSLTFLHLILRNTIQDMKQMSMYFWTVKQQSYDYYHLILGIRLPSVIGEDYRVSIYYLFINSKLLKC